MAAALTDAWRADRQEAESILSRYDQHILSSLPDMLTYWINTSAETFHGRAVVAFSLALVLHELTSGVKDATTGSMQHFPFGRDVVFADIAHRKASTAETDEAAAVQDTASLVSGILADIEKKTAAMVEDFDEDDVPASDRSDRDRLLPLQFAVPAAVGCSFLLTVQDATEVMKHIAAGNETSAVKLAAMLGHASSVLFPVSLGVDGRGCGLHPATLHARAVVAVKTIPTVLYRALSSLGCIGPGAFTAKPSPLLPPGLSRLPEGTSLALAYARHVEACFETEA